MSQKEKKTADSVMKSAGILVFTTLISSLLGYARNIIIPALFGKGIESDAYFAAFTIPDYVYTLLVGGALSSALSPCSAVIWQRMKMKRDTGWQVLSSR